MGIDISLKLYTRMEGNIIVIIYLAISQSTITIHVIANNLLVIGKQIIIILNRTTGSCIQANSN